MKELNYNNKLVRVADALKGVLEALDIQIGESEHRTTLLKTARAEVRKSIRSAEKTASKFESARLALRAIDDWDRKNTPGVAIDTPDTTDTTGTTDTTDTADTADANVTEAKREQWSQTLKSLFLDPDLQD